MSSNTNIKKKSLLDLYFKEQNIAYEKHGTNTVVLIQKGEFYEIYSVDPSFPKLCEILNLACTRTDTKKKQEVSYSIPFMAGFQHKFVDRYIKILLDKNYTIVIIDETGSQCQGGKISKVRSITRTITPSTFIESIETNLLMCVYLVNNDCSISTVDLSTGKIFLFGEYQYSQEIIRNIIAKSNPRELVFFFSLQDDLDKFVETQYKKDNTLLIKKKLINSKEYTLINYQNIFLMKVYNLTSIGITPIEHLHLDKLPLSSTILTIIIQYAIDHDPLLMTNLKLPEIFQSSKTLLLSENTIKQLHLFEIYKFLDFTSTSMGSRLLKNRIFNPFIKPKDINYFSIYSLSTNYKDIRSVLKNIRDLDRFQRRISTNKFIPTELNDTILSFKSCLEILLLVKDIWSISDTTINNLNSFLKLFDKYIDNTTRLFKPNNYPELDNLYNEKSNLLEEFEEIRSDLSLDGNTLKVGTTNNSLYFITSKKNSLEIDKQFEGIIIRGTKSECRISTKRVDEISDRINNIKESIETIEHEKFLAFCLMLSNKFSKTIIKTSQLISEIDFCSTCVHIMNEYNFTIPEFIDDNNITIEKMRHPLIESQISESYVANDLIMNDDNRGMLLFGQNFSGKTSYIRSVGVCIILAQAGMPVPASSMKYKPYNTLITKIALGDNLQRGQSTFTNEMKEIKNMIETTDENSIILADELCSGTETDSAISLVTSTLMLLEKNKCKYIFTTHFHDLVDIQQIRDIKSLHIYHMKVSIVNDKQIFNRILEPGKCEDNYGIEIAQHMKLPVEFIHQAVLIRNQLQDNKELINSKRSRYNKDVYMTECQICKSKHNLHTHHIIFQKDNKGSSKNFKNNLMVLCEECHEKVHKETLDINGYIQTSEGIINI